MSSSDGIDSFTLAQGFRAAATACGLKTSSVMGASSLDLALVVAEGPCAAAGVWRRCCSARKTTGPVNPT